MVNLCSHKIIAPPQLSDGQVVADKEGNVRVNNIENKTTDMSVPFAIGPVRVTEDKCKSVKHELSSAECIPSTVPCAQLGANVLYATSWSIHGLSSFPRSTKRLRRI